jgi:hypothetical protein
MRGGVASHTISNVAFAAGTNDGLLNCSCGQEMQASDFSMHRRDNANGKRLRYTVKVPLGYDQTPGWMRESRARRIAREAAS